MASSTTLAGLDAGEYFASRLEGDREEGGLFNDSVRWNGLGWLENYAVDANESMGPQIFRRVSCRLISVRCTMGECCLYLLVPSGLGNYEGLPKGGLAMWILNVAAVVVFFQCRDEGWMDVWLR